MTVRKFSKPGFYFFLDFISQLDFKSGFDLQSKLFHIESWLYAGLKLKVKIKKLDIV